MLHLRKATEIRSLATRILIVAGCRGDKRQYSAKDYDSSSSDDEKKLSKGQKQLQKENKIKTEATLDGDGTAAKRLNRLLASMQAEDNKNLSKTFNVNMARPGDANKKRKEAVKEKAAEKDILIAAKRVAELLGTGEAERKQSESELLSKLLGHSRLDVVGEGENSQSSAGNVTEAKDVEQTKKVKTKLVKAKVDSEISLSELIVGMKIDRRQLPKEQTRADYVRQFLGTSRKQQRSKDEKDRNTRARQAVGNRREAETYTGSVNLYGAEKLGYFKDVQSLQATPDILQTWSNLQQNYLQQQVAHPPANYFEKMALWTEQGKVWRFPIDNEQDWSDESPDVDFSEHIFLEQHLESWCPTRGPIRHFMELVCVGLSKNPYITAKNKKEHILWYRNYFEEKKDLLQEFMSKEKLSSTSTKGTKATETTA